MATTRIMPLHTGKGRAFCRTVLVYFADCNSERPVLSLIMFLQLIAIE